MKQWGSVLTMLVLLTALCTVSAVGSQERQVVRVAYPIQTGLTEIDEAGNYSGYLYEYLQEIAQYTGWEYEFVQAPGDINESILQLMDMLERGEVDLMGGMLFSQSLAETYDYAGYSMGTVYTTLSAPAESSYMWAFTPGEERVMRVATRQDTGPRIEELKNYCAMNQIAFELVLCDSAAEQEEALRSGRADVVLNVSLNPEEGLRDIARFAPRPFYCAVTKGREDLVSRLNNAIYSIEQADPYYSTRLYEKYFANLADKYTLTGEEQLYLERMEPLRVGVLRDAPPFQYLDEKGEICGISVAVLEYIAGETGLSYELIPVESQEKLQKQMQSGELDLAAGLVYNYEEALRKGVSMTRPYTSSQYMVMVNGRVDAAQLAGKRLALVEGFSSYQGAYQGEVQRYPTQEDCIRAVSRGEADYTYADSYVAQYYVNKPEFSSIKLTPLTYQEHQVCFGLAKPVDQTLLSILNKMILRMPTEVLQGLIYQSGSQREATTLKSFMQENPTESLLTVSGGFLCIIGALAWGLNSRVRMSRKMAMDMQKYTQLYELASEHFFEYDFRSNRLMLSLPKSEERTGADELFWYRFGGEKAESDRRREEEFLRFLRETGEGVADLQAQVPGGGKKWLRFTIKTLYDAGRPAYVIGKIINVEEEYREREQLRYQAEHDGLTQLYTPAVCREKITESLVGLHQGETGGLILLDVDKFKTVNDTHGHLEGDRVLRETAELLREIFREEDILGRSGGDEFAVYLRRIRDGEALKKKCEELNRRLREVGFSDGGHISCSIGAVITRAGDGFEAVYQRADALLYMAKDRGRDCFAMEE